MSLKVYFLLLLACYSTASKVGQSCYESKWSFKKKCLCFMEHYCRMFPGRTCYHLTKSVSCSTGTYPFCRPSIALKRKQCEEDLEEMAIISAQFCRNPSCNTKNLRDFYKYLCKLTIKKCYS